MTPSSPTRGWLTQDELDTWMRLFVLEAAAQSKLESQLRASEGITRFEFYVLAVLDEQHGTAQTMGELARNLHCSPSHLSHTVRKLEAAGWVVRSRTPGNARTSSISLTDAGRERLQAAAPGHVEAIRELIFDHLTDQQALAFRDALGSITAALAAHPSDGQTVVEGRCRALLGRTGESEAASQPTAPAD